MVGIVKGKIIHLVTLKEKEYLPMKDSDEDIVKWRAKKQNLPVYQK